MVCIIHDCHCDLCPGSTPAKNKHSKPGEMIFGGTLCNCECHSYSGKKRKIFLDIKFNRIPTAKGLRDKFNKDLEEMQTSCKHPLISKWMPSMWAPGHFGLDVKVCLKCDKVIETQKLTIKSNPFKSLQK